ASLSKGYGADERLGLGPSANPFERKRRDAFPNGPPSPSPPPECGGSDPNRLRPWSCPEESLFCLGYLFDLVSTG
ncbi:unnamed protein product, partial [Musa banksii]